MKYLIKHVSRVTPDAEPSVYMQNLNRTAMFKGVKFLKSVNHIPFVFLGDTEIEVENDDK